MVMQQEKELIDNSIPKGYFKGYDCSICSMQVNFPLCDNVEENKFDKLAWNLYMLKVKENPKLCFQCKAIYNKEIKDKEKKKIVFKKVKFICDEDIVDNKVKKRVVTREEIIKCHNLGFIDIDEISF